jgi:hypothetical protein
MLSLSKLLFVLSLSRLVAAVPALVPCAVTTITSTKLPTTTWTKLEAVTSCSCTSTSKNGSHTSTLTLCQRDCRCVEAQLAIICPHGLAFDRLRRQPMRMQNGALSYLVMNP